MTTVEYLAMIGFEWLSSHTPVYDDGDDYEAAQRAAACCDHEAVREQLLDDKPQAIQHFHGCRWGQRLITWPDRMPDLKTWAGQATLPKTISKLQTALRSAEWTGDLYTATVAFKGASGLDAASCPDAIDCGFSPNKLDVEIWQRPGYRVAGHHRSRVFAARVVRP